MMRPIHSLEDLRAAKQELAVRRQVAKQEFRKQLYVVQRETGSYLLKRVLLPLGLGVGAFLAYRYFSGKGKTQENQENRTDANQEEAINDLNTDQKKISWVSYISLLLSVVKIIQQLRANTGQRPSEEEPRPQTQAEENAEDGAFSPRDFVAGYRRHAAARVMENE